MPKIANIHQELGEMAQNEFSFRASRMKNPADILILGFGLQDCERINTCGFKPQIFVMAAPGNKYYTSVFYALISPSGSQDMFLGDIINLLVISTVFQFLEANNHFFFFKFQRIYSNSIGYHPTSGGEAKS